MKVGVFRLFLFAIEFGSPFFIPIDIGAVLRLRYATLKRHSRPPVSWHSRIRRQE